MKIIDKIIHSNTAPNLTNVLWADSVTNKLKIFKNGKWEVISTEDDPNIAAWAKSSTKPAYTAEEVSDVSKSAVVDGKMNFISELFSLDHISKADISNENDLEFIEWIVEKVEDGDFSAVKDKYVGAGSETAIIRDAFVHPIPGNTGQREAIIILDRLIYLFDDPLYRGAFEQSVSVLPFALNIRYAIPSREIIRADVLTLPYGNPKIVVDDYVDGTPIALKPNCFYVFGEVEDLNIEQLCDEERTGVCEEIMFEFISGSTPTTLTLPNTVEWPSSFTPEANKRYLIRILNDIASVVGVDYTPAP